MGWETRFQNNDPSYLEPRISNAESSLAEIASKKLYAKDHGVKLDGVTDDTVALNTFFALFGSGVELVVEGGVALVTGQLNLPGKWNPSTNNGVRKLTFDNAAINYQGQAGKACMQIYNHQKSLIDGLSILKGSQDTYVNIVGFWYSKLVNFEIPRLRFNYNTADITTTLSTADSYSGVFERGITYHGTEFYGVGQTGGGNINSLTFNDVKWQGNQVTPNAQYNLKFYGTSFQNFAFNYCDLSYATTANMYIDVTQLSTARLHFDSCYFDTGIPLIPNYEFKGAIISVENSQLSNGQSFFMKTKNKIGMTGNGNYGSEAGNIINAGLNLAKNGDFANASTFNVWTFSGGNSSSPTSVFASNTNTINNNSVQITFNQNAQYFGFSGISAPFDGYYTASARLRVMSGSGALQLNFRGTTSYFDLTQINAGEEVVLSSNASNLFTPQGTSLFFNLTCANITGTLVIEVLEVTIVQGTNSAINLPVHPKALLSSGSGNTTLQTGQMFSKSVGSFSVSNGVANQKTDIYFTGAFQGYIDVTVTGGWSSGNASGRLTKRFAFNSNSNAINYQESAYVETNGVTSILNKVAISDITYDSTNNRFKVQIVMLTSSIGDTFQVYAQAFCADSTSITTMQSLVISSVYTTDATVFPAPVRNLVGVTSFGGARQVPTTAKTGNYTLTNSDDTVLGNASSSAITITLPDATTCIGRIYTVKKTDSSANTVTIGSTSSQTIDGVTTKVISTQYTTVRIQSDGSNWWIV